LNGNKLIFVEFIQQMNIYFSERQIIHNNYLSMDEINDILIHIYIDEILQPKPTVINTTIETLLDMVDDKKMSQPPSPSKNPFSKFTFQEEIMPLPLPLPKQQPKQEIQEPLPKQQPKQLTLPLPLPLPLPKQEIQEPDNTKIRYKKKSIPLVLKRRLWNKYFGEHNGIAICPCCKLSQISTFSFHCGHIVSERNGGLLILDNLIPLCQSCNSSMGTKSYNEFCEYIGISNDIIN